MFPRYFRKLSSVPSGILNMFNDSSGRDHPKDSSEHQGRIRTFQHEVGNWASLVYIPGKSRIFGQGSNFRSVCQSLCPQEGWVSVMMSLPVMDSISTPAPLTGQHQPPGQHYPSEQHPPPHCTVPPPGQHQPLWTPFKQQHPLDSTPWTWGVMMSLPVMNTTPQTAPPHGQQHPPGQHQPWTAPPPDSNPSGQHQPSAGQHHPPAPAGQHHPLDHPFSVKKRRYASYWNAFLFKMYLLGDMFFELTAKV